MEKTITIKGVGNITAKPNLIVISMSLESLDLDYDKAMELATGKISDLTQSLESVGVQKSLIKTNSFNVVVKYDNVRDKDGNYVRQFAGYRCVHNLKLEFNFDTKRLAQILSAIASSKAVPELDIQFTIKDKEAVSEQLLEQICANARKNAEILCKSSGLQLGDLISINYDLLDVNLVSTTRYSMENVATRDRKLTAASLDFVPDDIKVADKAIFVWEIK